MNLKNFDKVSKNLQKGFKKPQEELKNPDREIIFAVPGSKVFISKYYKNRPNSFLNISLTGHKCDLLCKHCKGILLKNMMDLNDYGASFNHDKFNYNKNSDNRILNILDGFLEGTVGGVLLSGGFTKNGSLPLDGQIYKEIKEVKSKFGSRIKIFMHLGFVDSNTAAGLKDSNIDGVLVNIIPDKNAIENVYNLKGFDKDDYYKTIKILKNAGLKISPHIIIGISEGRITGELEAIDEISKIGVDSVVFVLLKKISSQINLNSSGVRTTEILDLFNYAEKIMPNTPKVLGCAKSAGPESSNLEINLLKNGISTIAFPSEKTIEFVIDNNLKYKFIEQCCAFI
ncbi:MAG: hypothetical protein M1308_08900 [Actinobacteria bacterium]|nr:hypothetical protein [Actinomycetota bacterium]